MQINEIFIQELHRYGNKGKNNYGDKKYKKEERCAAARMHCFILPNLIDDKRFIIFIAEYRFMFSPMVLKSSSYIFHKRYYNNVKQENSKPDQSRYDIEEERGILFDETKIVC